MYMLMNVGIVHIGPRILDEVLTPLLNDVASQRSEVALDGLKQVAPYLSPNPLLPPAGLSLPLQVMAVKSRVVLPHIIPQLVKPPVNARALALLSSVAGIVYGYTSVDKRVNCGACVACGPVA